MQERKGKEKGAPALGEAEVEAQGPHGRVPEAPLVALDELVQLHRLRACNPGAREPGARTARTGCRRACSDHPVPPARMQPRGEGTRRTHGTHRLSARPPLLLPKAYVA